MSQKVNITIGRFQPFTQGHLNMIIEGDAPCIVYRINSSKADEDTSKIKVKGKVVKKDEIKHAIEYIDNNGDGKLSETEKEILKRPFTNALIEKELEIVKQANKKYFVDVIYVTNAYEAIADFAYKVSQGLYEPQYLMCGDDRIDTYTKMIESDKPWKTVDGHECENVLKGKMTVNIGKGRTDGVSGTAVRQSIIKGDKSAFAKIMPNGADRMFDDFVAAFKTFRQTLSDTINEYINFTTLRDYITESVINTTYKPMIVEEALTTKLDYNDFAQKMQHSKKYKSIDVYELNHHKPFLIPKSCDKFPTLKHYIGWEVISMQFSWCITLTISEDENSEPEELEILSIEELIGIFGEDLLKKIYKKF